MLRVCEPTTKDDIRVFLAGGISNCDNWQEKVIEELKEWETAKNLENVVIDNPRRKHFDIEQDSSEEQIKWEFNKLEKCDIFSIYFCNSESVQPICMYELGRNILRMQEKFPDDWQVRIVISIEDGYSREQDVLIQSRLALKGTGVFINTKATPESHASYIIEAIDCIR